MPRKRYKAEEIVSKLRQVDVLVAQGNKVPDAVRSIGVTQVTYYRWRREYGGLQMDQVKRMKELELENQRLRRAVSVSDARQADLSGGRQGKLLSIMRHACFQHVPPPCLHRDATAIRIKMRLGRLLFFMLTTRQPTACPSPKLIDGAEAARRCEFVRILPHHSKQIRARQFI